MVLTPRKLDDISRESEHKAAKLEDAAWLAIMLMIADHYDDKADGADAWKAALLGYTAKVGTAINKKSVQTFAEAIDATDKAIKSVPYKEQAKAEEWLQSLAKQGKVHDPGTLEESKRVNKLVEHSRAQAKEYLKLASRNMKKHGMKTFRGIVSDASLAIKNGSTPQEALMQAARRWSDAGVPALVDKAGRRWHPDTYLRTVIQTQVKGVSNDVAIARAKDYGTYVIISSHINCRPSHYQYQGQIYSVNTDTAEYQNLYDATNFGSGGGLCGINCHHYPMSYVPEADTPFEPLQEQDASNKGYALTQQQRAGERNVRAAKRQLASAQQFGNDNDIAAAKRLVHSRQSQVRKLVNNHSDLVRDYSREKLTV